MNKNYEERLNRFHLSDEQRKKYIGINEQIQCACVKTPDELEKLGEHIAFAGFVKDGRLIVCDEEIRKGASLCLLPVATSADLLNLKDLKAARPAPPLVSLGVIKVYKHAYADEEPHLTRGDVLAQIPAELSGAVVAFCLHLEKKFSINGYNLLAQAYEYKVELFKK